MTGSTPPTQPLTGGRPRSPMACGTVRAPLARGRPRVLCTLLSRSRSQRSFTVQPAPRSRTAPVPNSASILMSGRLPGGAARAMLQKQGHARSQVPAEEMQSHCKLRTSCWCWVHNDMMLERHKGDSGLLERVERSGRRTESSSEGWVQRRACRLYLTPIGLSSRMRWAYGLKPPGRYLSTQDGGGDGRLSS